MQNPTRTNSMTMGRSRSTKKKLRMKAKKSSGYMPRRHNDDKTKGRRMTKEGRVVQDQVISMSKQGQRGVVSIDFKVFSWRC